MLNFIAVDFETANPKHGSICGIGIAHVKNSEIINTWSSLVKPPRSISHFAPMNTRIHGIKEHDVRDAPSWPETRMSLFNIIDNEYVIAHNASFEKSVIRQASLAEGLDPITPEIMCSVKLSQRLNPTFEKHKLHLLAKELKIDMSDFRHHDAGSDAIMAAKIVIAIAEMHNIDTMEELFELHGKSITTARNMGIMNQSRIV